MDSFLPVLLLLLLLRPDADELRRLASLGLASTDVGDDMLVTPDIY